MILEQTETRLSFRTEQVEEQVKTLTLLGAVPEIPPDFDWMKSMERLAAQHVLNVKA
jgi:hypothetical protein